MAEIIEIRKYLEQRNALKDVYGVSIAELYRQEWQAENKRFKDYLDQEVEWPINQA